MAISGRPRRVRRRRSPWRLAAQQGERGDDPGGLRFGRREHDAVPTVRRGNEGGAGVRGDRHRARLRHGRARGAALGIVDARRRQAR